MYYSFEEKETLQEKLPRYVDRKSHNYLQKTQQNCINFFDSKLVHKNKVFTITPRGKHFLLH